jgi:hypothetical protein
MVSAGPIQRWTNLHPRAGADLIPWSTMIDFLALLIQAKALLHSSRVRPSLPRRT